MRNLFRITLAVAALGYVARARFMPVGHAPNAQASATANAAAPVSAPRTLGKLAFQPCTLASKLGIGTIEAQCTKMQVPEDWDQPQGRRIDLAIAWVPARSADAPDPVFMIAGGPGQSALDSYPSVASAFDETLKKRSVILVDQRGTGHSNPLACENKQGKKMSEEEQQAAENDPAAIRKLTEECRDTLAKKADLRLYTTTDALRDLDAVRAAIGAEKIDMVGISYGTRVAQQYARTYAAHTRAVVLDSVAPNELIFGNDFARNLDDALALEFKRCAGVPACAQRMGDPKAQLDSLLAQLKAHPQPVEYRDPLTGEYTPGTLTRGDVALVARLYAYEPIALATLPLSLSEAMKGHYESLKAQSKLVSGDLGDSMMAGMQLSVICAEDADGRKVDPALADSVLGNQMLEILKEQCAIWPRGQRPADFHDPLVSDLPILVLEGEFDPVTPPRYGEQVVKNLKNGRLLVLRGQGHNVIGVGCMPRLMARFLDTANAKALDDRCLAKLPYTPPFTSYNGWEP
ncbi:MAG TPA: alpha/beta hydrolase [Xanthomonadaceae bacterium]|jgi:pimeloyl-ACP methyl ester carboxylesterase